MFALGAVEGPALALGDAALADVPETGALVGGGAGFDALEAPGPGADVVPFGADESFVAAEPVVDVPLESPQPNQVDAISTQAVVSVEAFMFAE